MLAQTISRLLLALLPIILAWPFVAGPSGENASAAGLTAVTICLNEILPRPCDDQAARSVATITSEFIELYNLTSETVDLEGWALEVTGGASGRYTLPAGTLIGPRGYRVFYQQATGLVLPNTSACVRLLDPSGMVSDLYCYGSSKCNLSYGRLPDGGSWHTDLPPSPGSANVRPTATPTASPTPANTPTPTATPSPTRTLQPTATHTHAITPSRTLSATRTPTPRPTPTPMPTGYAHVCLSEFLPVPRAVDWDGDGVANYRDEWIELYNASDQGVSLAGWRLDDRPDGGSTPFTFPVGTVLGSRAYGVYYLRDTGVVLNNDGDQVRLIAPDGSIQDQVDYQVIEADASYGRRAGCEGEWVLCRDPSPGEENRPPTPMPTWPLYVPLLIK